MNGTEHRTPVRIDSSGTAGAGAAQVERLKSIFELAPVGIGIVDLEGRTTMTNELLRRLLGYSADEFATIPFAEFTHPDDVARNLELFAQLANGEVDNFAMEKRFIRKDGEILWADLTVSMVRDADGNPDYAIGMTQDVTDRKRLESDLRAAEERYRLLVERVPAVVYIAEPGPAGRWHYVSPQIERMLGFTAQDWIADPALWLRQLHPQDREAALADKNFKLRTGREGESSSDTYRLRRRDGVAVWVRDDAMVLRDQEGRATFHGVLVDVTQEKRLENRLGHQASHDALTGLPNRTLFRDRVDHALTGSRSQRGQVVVLFIDLDNFKTINDSFGHACGDEMIVAAARRLRTCLRAGDTAARLGGDEFALLVQDLNPAEVTALASRVLDALRTTAVELSGRTVMVAASIGIAVSGPGETTETLLRNADLAMYEAKSRGRGRHVLYDPGMHATVVSRFQLEESLRSAVTAGAITLMYQPIANLRTGAVVGLEALVRGADPPLGEVPPSLFIPIAEQTGLIHDLGRWALDRACRDLTAWRASTGSDAYVSVNVSPLQLDDEFPSVVDQILRDHGLAPSALVLEVTEGMFLAGRSRDSLRTVRALGVRVAIDDFGTGYSSLSYLRDLPVDIVKIDRAFLRSAGTGPEDPAFLRAILRLAQTLHLTTICEGIETRGQVDELRAAGCGYGQGFFLAEPGPLAGIPTTIQAIGRAGRT